MKRIYIIILLIGLLFLMPIIIYFSIFHGSISYDHSYWSEFSTIWSSFIGTIISSITIAFLVIESKKNEKDKIFQQQLDIYFRQLEKLSLLYPIKNNKNCFRQFVDVIENKIRIHFDSYLYNYYAETNILDWPFEAFKYFIKKSNYFLSLQKEYPDLENSFYSNNDKKYIEQKWFKYTNGNNKLNLVESLKGFFGRPLEDIDECMKIFSMFTDLCGTNNYNIKNLYNVSFDNAMIELNYNLNSYFEMHCYSVKMLKNYNELLKIYLSQITNDEKTLIIYYLLNSNDIILKLLHIKNNFINNTNGIMGVYMDNRIKEMLINT